jgi:hypothetical protein
MFLWTPIEVVGLDDFLSRPFRITYNGIIHLYGFGNHKGAIQMAIIIDIMFLIGDCLKIGNRTRIGTA